MLMYTHAHVSVSFYREGLPFLLDLQVSCDWLIKGDYDSSVVVGKGITPLIHVPSTP